VQFKPFIYSSYFEQTVGEENRRLATGKQRQKQKNLPRINTEKHGKTRKRQKQRHGKEEEEIATETKHFFQSRMRERRYKFAVW
jgi:hypothetical protein